MYAFIWTNKTIDTKTGTERKPVHKYVINKGINKQTNKPTNNSPNELISKKGGNK